MFLDLRLAIQATQKGELSFEIGGESFPVTCDKVRPSHQARQQSKTKWGCKVCPLLADGEERFFGSKNTLERHYRQHFPVMLGYLCPKCRRFFYRKDRECTKCLKPSQTKSTRKRKSHGADSNTPAKKAK